MALFGAAVCLVWAAVCGLGGVWIWWASEWYARRGRSEVVRRARVLAVVMLTVGGIFLVAGWLLGRASKGGSAGDRATKICGASPGR